MSSIVVKVLIILPIFGPQNLPIFGISVGGPALVSSFLFLYHSHGSVNVEVATILSWSCAEVSV